MTYNKPTIEVLGNAVRVIEGPTKNTTSVDGPNQATGQVIAPAYDLDE